MGILSLYRYHRATSRNQDSELDVQNGETCLSPYALIVVEASTPSFAELWKLQGESEMLGSDKDG